MNLPAVNFDHLFRLSDDTGLLEHARGALPRRECGYCLDDVARGLVVLAREPRPTPEQISLSSRYLTFVAHAQADSGACHNRLSYDRRWLDQPTKGDWWGRAVWGLGCVVSGSGPDWQRLEALDRFSLSCTVRSPWARATAFATLGAAEVVAVSPGHLEARRVLADSIISLGRPGTDPDWPWPERRLTYANPVLAEALIAAGTALGDRRAVEDGLHLLSWLVKAQSHLGHLSLIPAGGRDRGMPGPAFDQQPIEATALADACARAFVATGDDRWRSTVGRCLGWFLGDNDTGVAMYDPATGGGYDGLQGDRPNLNQGAESTMAWLLTLQHGRRMALDEPKAPAAC